MTTVYQPRQRKADLRWDYTRTSGAGVYALGYCASRPEGHPDGHDTAAEAAACYSRFQAREEVVFGDHPDEQRRCRVCGAWTTREAVVGREIPARYPLCPEHATLPHVETLHTPGDPR